MYCRPCTGFEVFAGGPLAAKYTPREVADGVPGKDEKRGYHKDHIAFICNPATNPMCLNFHLLLHQQAQEFHHWQMTWCFLS